MPDTYLSVTTELDWDIYIFYWSQSLQILFCNLQEVYNGQQIIEVNLNSHHSFHIIFHRAFLLLVFTLTHTLIKCSWWIQVLKDSFLGPSFLFFVKSVFFSVVSGHYKALNAEKKFNRCVWKGWPLSISTNPDQSVVTCVNENAY